MLNKRFSLATTVSMVPILFFVGYQAYKNIGDINANKVLKMTVRVMPGQEEQHSYDFTAEKNSAEIQKCVAAYNNATLYRQDVGTTHPVSITLTMYNGEKIIVLGGTQGFQTVRRNDKQFNIRSTTLDNYFKVFLK